MQYNCITISKKEVNREENNRSFVACVLEAEVYVLFKIKLN